MRVFYWSGVLVTTTVLLSACTVGESTPTATSSPSPVAASPPATTPSPATSTTTAPSTSKSAVKVTPDAAKKPLFNKAFVASQNTIAGLINTTDKLQRLDLLSKKVNVTTNRQRDPFAVLPGSLPPLPVLPSQTKPQLPSPAPRVRVGKPPVLPPPDPTEAKSINVSGVMEMDGTQYAIVNVPGEPTPRYVKVGQRLVNNQVLVKRIETAGTPTVIFQQFNVEVPRPVGLLAVAPNAPANSGLANPNAPTPNTGTTVTPPTGVILPPAPNATSPVLPQDTVNRPIVTPAGVPPLPGLVLPQQQ
ncbi:hypothetical protein [Pseudanabaena sp. PCC 6802]|uniref:hypothetical protein n=1 Tax=Pseudanabaena sp. PCC 6802 TaxID=118173 RepID=UPI000344E30A|nr:hypothetical protein [Pseudanabaena sp. PCC 6802]